MNSEAKFESVKDVISRRNQDGTVILMKLDESSIFYRIDGIAAEVWSELNKTQSLGGLIEKFSAKHEGCRDRIEKDIPAFVHDLLKRKLVVET